MTDPIRIGTRASPLARAQTERFVRRLRAVAPSRAIEITTLVTSGDRTRGTGRPLDFTGALAEALRARAIDLAVHSAKDLPAGDPPDLPIVAYPARADPRDAVVARRWPLPPRATLGTSSVRRQAQWARARPDLRLVPIRGNVDTRLAMVRRGRVDAVVLARAGMERLGRADEITATLPLASFVPAPGQGILAVQGRAGDRALRAIVRRCDDPATRACATIERSITARLGGDCDVPLGVVARRSSGRTTVRAEVLSLDGRRAVRLRYATSENSPARIAAHVAARLTRMGALELLPRLP